MSESAEGRADGIDLRNIPKAREAIAEAIRQAEAAAVKQEREVWIKQTCEHCLYRVQHTRSNEEGL